MERDVKIHSEETEANGNIQNETKKSAKGDSASITNLQISAGGCPGCCARQVHPTKLNCGHSIGQQCLAALWVNSNASCCPQRRKKWEEPAVASVPPKQVTAMVFPKTVVKRGSIQQIGDTGHGLKDFHKRGKDQRVSWQRGWALPFGFLACLATVTFTLHVYLWISNKQPELDPLAHLKAPCSLGSRNYSPENSSHKETFLLQLENLKLLKPKQKLPKDLWEFKAAKPKPMLFLLHALNASPRLGILYIYYFDYTESFLPFIHTVCPVQQRHKMGTGKKLSHLRPPTWGQWRKLLFKLILAYQLVAEFAWSWLGIHYWTSWFIIINAMLLSCLELLSVWSLWLRKELKTIPWRMWQHFWHVSIQGLAGAILWYVIPPFVWDCAFYWKVYCSPIMNLHNVVRELRHLESRVL